MIDAWETINATQTDANSPLDQPLMDAYRLRDQTLFDWLGKNYTPTDDHKHNGSDSATIPQTSLSSTTVGTAIAADMDVVVSERTTVSASYVLLGRFWINRPGTWRVYMRIKQTGGGTADVQIDLDGGSVSGATTSTGSSSYIDVSFDIANCVVGSFIDFQLKRIGGTSAEITEMRLGNHGGSSVVQAGWEDVP